MTVFARSPGADGGDSRDGVLRESYLRHGEHVDVEVWHRLTAE